MKLVTYRLGNRERIGLWHDGSIFNLPDAAKSLGFTALPDDMLDFIRAGEASWEVARKINAKIRSGNSDLSPEAVGENALMAPVPRPTSCRDGYAFRQHVAAARRNRKVPMIPEFDQYPIFYFTNHNAIQGPGEIRCMPDHFQKLDFELESAIVIGKKGRNIRASEADQYIFGYLIMNDMSARTLQMEEMVLNLGPAKGKDFSTVIGPWLVTPDELESHRVSPKPGHVGNSYDLTMKCWVNDKLVSSGNMKDMDWTFAEIVERCAYGVDILPGDVIGSGTVGTGCFLELNGTGLLQDPNYPVQWLQDGDRVDMEITGLGRLSNTIRKENTDFSLLAIKKQAQEA